MAAREVLERRSHVDNPIILPIAAVESIYFREAPRDVRQAGEGSFMPDALFLQFRIVVYPSEDNEGGKFTAHCLNMDVLADADTVEGAVSELLETIEASIEAADKHDANAFGYAPEKYWQMLHDAKLLPQELADRIYEHANQRNGSVNVRRQCDLRELQLA